MAELSLALIVGAFISGLVMFLAPCTLPLVPAYLAFISGVTERTASTSRKQLFTNALGFCIGFTVIFVGFGVLAGFFGSFVGSVRDILLPLGGFFIFLFGLLMLNILQIPFLTREYKLHAPRILRPGNPLGATIIGATFALGWSPCIGPVLATILLLASLETTVVSGGILLFIFSIGLSVPFLLTALLYAQIAPAISTYSRASVVISRIGGGILVALGILLMFDAFGVFVSYGQNLFYLLGLEFIFEYL